MTRQRIEHVGESFDEMCAHLGEATGAPSSAHFAPFLFQAAQIQLRQTESVFDELNRAAVDLKSGIENLRTDTSAAAEVAVKVGSTASEANVARQCEADIGNILTIIRQSVSRIGDILAAFQPLQASFIDCTSKASELAVDLRHTALNAQIFAIQAPDGAALEVLSGRVRVISDEAIQQVRLMGAELQRTVALVTRLQANLGEFQHLGQMELEVLSEESLRSQHKLSELESAIPALIRGIGARQGVFARSVEKILARVQFPDLVAGARVRSIGLLQELLAWSQEEGSTGNLDAAASAKIEAPARRYTMDSERQAHAAALHHGVAPSDSSDASIDLFAPAAPSADEDFGDNIELF